MDDRLASIGSASNSSSQKGSLDNQSKHILGRYKPIRVLGEGSFAKVRLAEDSVTGEQVAIKCFEKSRLGKPSSLIRLKREIRLLKHLHHPNIVKLLTVGETHDHVYLVMEHVDGGELFDFIVAQGKLKETQARRFFRMCVSALEYCHLSCIVHRDLKPENMLVDSRSKVKIVDFGFVNTFRPDQRLNTFCGSLLYAAPEMIGKSEYSGSTVDIWSLGICLYALLTGNLPFNERTPEGMYRLITTARYEVPDFLSDEAKNLLSRMLTVDPVKRATISEIRTHPWTTGREGVLPSAVPPRPPLAVLDENVLARMKALGFDSEAPDVRKRVLTDVRSPEFAVYYLIIEHEKYAVELDRQARHSVHASRPQISDLLMKGSSVAAEVVEEEDEEEGTEPTVKVGTSPRPSIPKSILSLEDINEGATSPIAERRSSRIMSRRVSASGVVSSDVHNATTSSATLTCIGKETTSKLQIADFVGSTNDESVLLSKTSPHGSEDDLSGLRSVLEKRHDDAPSNSAHRRTTTAPAGVAPGGHPASTNARKTQPASSSHHGRRATLGSLDPASLPKTLSSTTASATSRTNAVPNGGAPTSTTSSRGAVPTGRRHSIQVTTRDGLPGAAAGVTGTSPTHQSEGGSQDAPGARRPLLSASLTTTLALPQVHAELARSIKAAGVRGRAEGGPESAQFKCTWDSPAGEVGPGAELGGEVEFEVVTRHVDGTKMSAVYFRRMRGPVWVFHAACKRIMATLKI